MFDPLSVSYTYALGQRIRSDPTRRESCLSFWRTHACLRAPRLEPSTEQPYHALHSATAHTLSDADAPAKASTGCVAWTRPPAVTSHPCVPVLRMQSCSSAWVTKNLCRTAAVSSASPAAKALAAVASATTPALSMWLSRNPSGHLRSRRGSEAACRAAHPATRWTPPGPGAQPAPSDVENTKSPDATEKAM